MKRRSFLRNSAFAAFAVSNSGFIHFNGTKYVGDCETTTDILGPFYRANSPVRTNLVVEGEAGDKILLEGVVKHSDCITPCKNARIELWHCNSAGEYDNDSNDFRHRGTTFSDEDGQYHFSTILPVPYKVSENYVRPAHFHMMITADGYQQLVTQLYFEGDTHLKNDSYASSSTAAKRILAVKTMPDKSKKLVYDIGMAKKLTAEKTAIDKLTGTYVSEDTKRLFFTRHGEMLCVEDKTLEYTGNNTFIETNGEARYFFKLLADGNVRVQCISNNVVEMTGTRTI